MSRSSFGSVWLLPAAIVLGALLLGGFSGRTFGQRVYAYQWSDARFCNDCHAHDYANEAWEASAHAGLTTCHDCHLVPIRHYPRNLWVMLTKPPKTAQDIPHPEVPIVICQKCHVGECEPHGLSGPLDDELCAQVVKVDESPLHSAHLEAERPGRDGGLAGGPITCEDCHGGLPDAPHSFETRRAACEGCHEDHDDETVADLPCRQCHGARFLAPDGAQSIGSAGSGAHDNRHKDPARPL